jgi:hypothetical protein
MCRIPYGSHERCHRNVAECVWVHQGFQLLDGTLASCRPRKQGCHVGDHSQAPIYGDSKDFDHRAEGNANATDV